MSDIRLVDANALKKDIEQWFVKDKYYTNHWHNKIPKSEVFDVIDNAPTIEINEDTVKEVLNRQHLAVIPAEFLIELQLGCVKTRPRGEWTIQSSREGTNHYVCSICKHEGDFFDTFCRNCGADMRGEGEE